MRRLVVLGAVAALTLPPRAAASIWITNGARAPTLGVDSHGNAEIGWRDTRGLRHTLLVPPRGRVLPGGHAGRDVSRRVGLKLPLARVVRRTPDGRLWALQ